MSAHLRTRSSSIAPHRIEFNRKAFKALIRVPKKRLFSADISCDKDQILAEPNCRSVKFLKPRPPSHRRQEHLPRRRRLIQQLQDALLKAARAGPLRIDVQLDQQCLQRRV